MPNWCYNSATLICSSKEIYDKLLQSMKDGNWFDTFVPLGLENNEYKYELACEMWGTKWSPTDVTINNEDEENFTIDVSFETAWAPPIGVYKTMNEKYSIYTTAFYCELGCEFYGKCVYSDSEQINECFDLPKNQEELLELQKKISSELNDYMMSTWEYLEEQWETVSESED